MGGRAARHLPLYFSLVCACGTLFVYLISSTTCFIFNISFFFLLFRFRFDRAKNRKIRSVFSLKPFFAPPKFNQKIRRRFSKKRFSVFAKKHGFQGPGEKFDQKIFYSCQKAGFFGAQKRIRAKIFFLLRRDSVKNIEEYFDRKSYKIFFCYFWGNSMIKWPVRFNMKQAVLLLKTLTCTVC